MSQKSILIVEDNLDNRQLLEWILEDAELPFYSTGHVIDALDLLEAHNDISLVLMDISLPDIDGMEGTRRIRNNPKTAVLPVFAVTAHAIHDEAEKIRSCGINELIAKPVNEDILLSLIKNYLH